MFTTTTVTGESWAAGFLYHGLRQLLGDRLDTWLGRKSAMYEGYKHHGRLRLYGNGFSWSRSLPQPATSVACGAAAASTLERQRLLARMNAGYYSVLLISVCHNNPLVGCDLRACYGASVVASIREYLRRHAPEVHVVTLDGNDVHGSDGRPPCHTVDFGGQLPRVDIHFLREVVSAVSPTASLAGADERTESDHANGQSESGLNSLREIAGRVQRPLDPVFQ